MTQLAIRIRIHGRVQGVGYRAWTVGQARQHQLHGWVRNRTDGTVEALFVGEPDRVEKMIELCHEGPLAARVDRIDQEEAEGITPAEFVSKPTV